MVWVWCMSSTVFPKIYRPHWSAVPNDLPSPCIDLPSPCTDLPSPLICRPHWFALPMHWFAIPLICRPHALICRITDLPSPLTCRQNTVPHRRRPDCEPHSWTQGHGCTGTGPDRRKTPPCGRWRPPPDDRSGVSLQCQRAQKWNSISLKYFYH